MFRFTSLVSFLFLFAIATIDSVHASLGDLRFWANKSCSGGVFTQCTNLSAGTCCITSASGSAEAVNGNSQVTVYGWSGNNCKGSAMNTVEGKCGGPGWFNMFSGQLYQGVGSFREVSTKPNQTAQVDSIGYFDGKLNKTVSYKIPDEHRLVLLAAFSEGKVETIKAHAPTPAK